jgi:hypothetical protein
LNVVHTQRFRPGTNHQDLGKAAIDLLGINDPPGQRIRVDRGVGVSHPPHHKRSGAQVFSGPLA